MSISKGENTPKNDIAQVPRVLAVIGKPGNYYCFPSYVSVDQLIADYKKLPDSEQVCYEIYFVPFDNWFKAKEIYLISDKT
jgi:hypothetical protein